MNRNVNHVIIEALPRDLDVFMAVFENVVRYHKNGWPSTARIKKRRGRTMRSVQALCKLAHNDAPSFIEAQFFLDGLHTDQERRTLITNLPTLLNPPASAREIRGLLLRHSTGGGGDATQA